MDKQAMIRRHLEQARRHVTEGEKHIERQRTIVGRLEAMRIDATEARRLLSEFEALQELHVADRDRLERELAEASAP